MKIILGEPIRRLFASFGLEMIFNWTTVLLVNLEGNEWIQEGLDKKKGDGTGL